MTSPCYYLSSATTGLTQPTVLPRNAWAVCIVALDDLRGGQCLSAQHLSSECYQCFRVAERRFKIVAADVEQAVVSLILEVQQSL